MSFDLSGYMGQMDRDSRSSQPVTRFLPSVVGFVLLALVIVAVPAPAKASMASNVEESVGALVSGGGSSDGTAAVAAMRKSKVIARSDRFCRSQVPRFQRIERRINSLSERIAEAESAGDTELALALTVQFGNATGQIAVPLAKRKNRITRISKKARKKARPRAYLQTLGKLNGSLRNLGRVVVTWANDPTETNETRVLQASKRTSRHTNANRAAGKRYGFRSCWKPLSQR
ncbi:MAG: hypothetical protein M3Y23_04660 [Actinomycetota bacterium]|nr:hypothetical protein [Actinomycetota bacterium]